MKKRVLSLILFLCLILTMVPISILAAGDASEDVPDDIAPTVPVITRQPESCDIVIG